MKLMPLCDRCNHLVKPTDLICTTCGLQLKAHGHPSIDLYQSLDDTILCESCVYHHDESCTFPQRPQARSCTLYQSTDAPAVELATRSPVATGPSMSWIWQRYKTWLILGALFSVCLLLAVMQ